MAFLVLYFIAILLISNVDARGRKKKKRSGGSSGGPTCETLGLDCSATCCLDIECALDLTECAGYITRAYSEVYIGFGALIALVVGIPLSIKVINFCLTYKFCQKFDEQANSNIGGASICEGLIKIFTCCKKQPNIPDVTD